jgi:AsmA protein
MVRILRIAAFLAAGAALAVLAAAFAAPHLVTADAMRRAVAAEIAGITGQPVTISGRSRFVALPWPTVTVEMIEVGGEGQTNLVSSGGLEARLALWPLLMGRSEVAGVTLYRPQVVLHIDGEGRSNWRAGTSMLSMPQLDSSRGARLGDVTIVDGNIVLRDDQARRRTELADMNGTVSWPFLGSGLTVLGRTRLRGEEIRLQGSVAQPSAVFARDISSVEFTLETPAVRAQVTGNLFAGSELQLEGRMTFSSPSIRSVAAWLLPEVQNAPDIGPLQGTSRLKLVDRTLTLDETRLTADRSRGQGAVALTFDRTRTLVQGTMDFDSIDVRPFMQTQVVLAESGGVLSSERIEADRIGLVDVDFRVSADALRFGATTVRGAALSFLSRDRRIEASLGDGQVFGGRVQGRLVTEARAGGGVRVRAMVAASGIRLEDSLRELFGVVRVAGAGGATVDLTGEGFSAQEVVRSMRGEASLRITQGALAGIDLPTLIRRAERNPVEALLDARGGRTAIEQASATFAIAEARATTEDLLVRGPGYRVAMRGVIEALPPQLSLSGSLASAGDVRQVVELPFVIRGPLTDPVIVPNPEALLRAAPPSRIQ